MGDLAGDPCLSGRGWTLDGVRFEFLHPGPQPFWRGNDASCVLEVSSPAGRVLLTGDVEALGELAMHFDGRLRPADVVVAPHHGSRTSSSASLVEASRPALVVFSSGRYHRWQQPHPDVVARWTAAGARDLQTRRDGAVLIRLEPGRAPAALLARETRAARWRVP